MNNVCVTGGLGFIGSHLAAKLNNPRIIDMKQDIRMRLPPETLNGVDTVYHLAALSNIIPSITHPRNYYETNVTGTFNMLEAARHAGVKKFVYAASASCYGAVDGQMNERCRSDPAYPYALTKNIGEQMVIHYGKVYGIDIVSLRIFNCYGPNSLTKSPYGAMFNTFLAQRANDRPLTVIGDGTQSRDFVYVDDVVEAFILAAEKGSGIYNVGTGTPTSINRIAELIGGDSIHIPERYGEPHKIYADNSKIRSLGWEPKFSIEQGIALMIDNLDYWKEAKIWEPETIAKETQAWNRHLA